MRIVILTAIPFWHPGTLELMDQIRKNDIDITALDIFHGRLVNEKNELINLLPFGLRGILAKSYLKLFRKSFTRKHTKDADILDIHFVEPAYTNYLLDLPNKIICTLFGSDLFRTTPEQKKLQIGLFKRANCIVLSKNMIDCFNLHFSGNEKKFFYNQYGSSRIDKIIEQKKDSINDNLKSNFKIKNEKIVITCGYNNKREQQHLLMISELGKLPLEIKNRIFLVIPMTYGDEELSYIKEVEISLNECKIEYMMPVEYLDEVDLVRLKLVSDVTINTQTTDALSSSVKEAMVAGDVMLLGEWLPYDIYTELGVFYKKIAFSTLKDNIIHVLNNLEDLKKKSTQNEAMIKNFASWEVLTGNWLELYKKIYSGS